TWRRMGPANACRKTVEKWVSDSQTLRVPGCLVMSPWSSILIGYYPAKAHAYQIRSAVGRPVAVDSCGFMQTLRGACLPGFWAAEIHQGSTRLSRTREGA